jgi:TusA-related sulfurtransferase
VEHNAQIDLRGQACPMNFVRIKLALEKLDRGDTLLALVDSEPVSADVERSLIAQGYSVHCRREMPDHAVISVSRR